MACIIENMGGPNLVTSSIIKKKPTVHRLMHPASLIIQSTYSSSAGRGDEAMVVGKQKTFDNFNLKTSTADLMNGHRKNSNHRLKKHIKVQRCQLQSC